MTKCYFPLVELFSNFSSIFICPFYVHVSHNRCIFSCHPEYGAFLRIQEHANEAFIYCIHVLSFGYTIAHLLINSAILFLLHNGFELSLTNFFAKLTMQFLCPCKLPSVQLMILSTHYLFQSQVNLHYLPTEKLKTGMARLQIIAVYVFGDLVSQIFIKLQTIFYMNGSACFVKITQYKRFLALWVFSDAMENSNSFIKKNY